MRLEKLLLGEEGAGKLNFLWLLSRWEEEKTENSIECSKIVNKTPLFT